jgi:serine/threonine protein kinase
MDSHPDTDEGPVSAIAPTIALQADDQDNGGFRHTRTAIVDAASPSSRPPSTARLPEVGDTVGHYVLVQKLGEGAHGAVYRAHRVGLEEHRVALKIIPCTRERLPLVRQELVTLATVVHPNIVQLSDHDVQDGFAWFTMPFYEGTPLDVRLAERFRHNETLSLEEAYDIFQPLAGALAALHASGFRHQDI